VSAILTAMTGSLTNADTPLYGYAEPLHNAASMKLGLRLHRPTNLKPRYSVKSAASGKHGNVPSWRLTSY
jgi:hypothetical protein